MRIVSNGRAICLAARTVPRPGERWATRLAALERRVPALRDALQAHHEPFGVALCLTPATLAELEAPAAFARFRVWLDAERCDVFTIDAAPDGAPDATARFAHVRRVATLLARLVPPDGHGTIGTPLGTTIGTRPEAPIGTPDGSARALPGERAGPAGDPGVVDGVLGAVAHCARLERDGGARIALAIEPGVDAHRPCGTTDPTLRLVTEELASMRGTRRLAALLGASARDARRALRRHLGVCHDIADAAFGFDDALGVPARYAAAGIDVVKLRLGSILHLGRVDEALVRRLARLDARVLERPVLERRGRTLTRHAHVGVAIDAARYRLERRSTLDTRLQVPLPREAASGRTAAGAAPTIAWRPIEEPATEWRVHALAPVFGESAGLLRTTGTLLAELLERQRLAPFCHHLELAEHEPALLPADYRDAPPAVAVARELDWVRARL